MKKYYITGAQGTGKTAITAELRRRGLVVFDTDTAPNVSSWRNIATGEKVFKRTGMRKDWLQSHEWYCDPEALKAVLDKSSSEIIFICGISDNQEEYIGLFDRIFLLQCSEKTLLHRIATRTDHQFGKDDSEREYILGFYKDFEKQMLARGASPIDSEKPVELVADEILSKI